MYAKGGVLGDPMTGGLAMGGSGDKQNQCLCSILLIKLKIPFELRLYLVLPING